MKTNQKKKKRKPISFSTTMRNPSRVLDSILILSKFEDKILNNEVINEILIEMLKKRFYRPTNLTPVQKEYYNNLDAIELSNKEYSDILKNNPQKHKQAGFDCGWPSRFKTLYELQMIFGYVYLEMNKKIQISELGKEFLKNDDDKLIGNLDLENQIFLNSLSKYQTDNPFKRIELKMTPLSFLMRVLKELKTRLGQDALLNLKEIPFLVSWINNNEIEFVDFLINFRNNFSKKYSDEIVYTESLKLFGITELKSNYLKMEKLLKEGPDDFIRKIRKTGLITIRGGGRYLDFNYHQMDNINYVIEKYSEIINFNSELDYYNYISKKDPFFFAETVSTIQQTDFKNISKKWKTKEVEKELQILTKKNTSSKDPIFKYIEAPARFELLTSLLIQYCNSDAIVKPNYPMDDEGLPTSHAAGGKPDIEVVLYGKKYVFEVSLITTRVQLSNEIVPIERHLKNLKDFECAYFIAPSMHPDTLRMTDWMNQQNEQKIHLLSIEEFIKKIKNDDLILKD